MNRKQKAVVVAGAVALLLMILYPPFFGIDRGSGGRRHAFIGYRAVWSPPSPSEVYLRLTSQDPTGVAPSRLAAFEARVNVVRLALNVAGLGVAVALGAWLTGRKTTGA